MMRLPCIVDYDAIKGDESRVTHSGFMLDGKKPENGVDETPGGTTTSQSSTGMGTYLQGVHYGTLAKNYWPLPLLRNHIYRLTLGGTRSSGELDFSISLDEMYTKDICFE